MSAPATDHKSLVKKAASWLRREAIVEMSHPFWISSDPAPIVVRPMRCSVVATELRTSADEIADAIGFAYGGRWTVLVECKATLSDYYADKAKEFRRLPELGMGQFRYYLAPKGMITLGSLPERWGLLELNGGRIEVARVATNFSKWNFSSEIGVALSLYRRAIGGEDVEKYTMVESEQ